MPISEDTFFLNPDAEGTLQNQIQQIVAEAILSGRFRPGEKMPSSRKLARHLGVSRITVTLAYTELLADDYLTSRGRSGYYISENAPQPPKFAITPREDKVDWAQVLPRQFSGGVALTKPADWQRYKYPFIYGQADGTLFDRANWRLCALKALGSKDYKALTGDYFDRDDPKLIEFVLRHTLPRRGIAAEPNEVLITMGAQNALWLAAQALLGPDKQAVLENPCYPSLRDVLHHTQCQVHSVDVDHDGLPPDDIPFGTDVVFTTPSHQCPTTATMPLPRRKALLEKARDDNFLIIEDDYEFEMSFLSAPSPALKSLDRDGRVIYVGSFSKSLFPGLRLGYLVGSSAFIDEVRALRTAVLRHPPGLMQRSAAYFLSLGHYDALIRRMGKAFHERRHVMDQAIQEVGLTIAGQGVYGGSSFWMQSDPGVDTTLAAQRLQDKGVLIEPGQPFFGQTDDHSQFFRLAYSSIQASKIPEGIRLIASEVLKK
ncbi:MAG: PLP-dependent aminotransferase family protein [Pseudomonadota bacterium]